MPTLSYPEPLREQTKILILWIISGLIEAVFLLVWLIVQLAISGVITNLDLTESDLFMFQIFQITFAIVTLTPILKWAVKDNIAILIRVVRQILLETQTREEATVDSNDTTKSTPTTANQSQRKASPIDPKVPSEDAQLDKKENKKDE